ncbi:anaerobic ribonucleoside triphosphate reductase [Paenibacillus bovis]|uniref:Anaerobic ribonucleoside-triphosphate reductase n=1 Tax=Paenibacillus bovis TaxID=1616788 RepID=A0A172ZDH5_9BACL|nr:anaerobic ribonucleoside triphosphate reductase [Paenibacillus bovis]ANF95412.1 anaerobic ribonucleoside-triphosphate reductase [Paenibacillus bovis]
MTILRPSSTYQPESPAAPASDTYAHLLPLAELGDHIIHGEHESARENANLNGDSFSGKMSRLGSEYARWYTRQNVLPEPVQQAVQQNRIYIHDLDHYALGTTNCIFIPFEKLLRDGFSSGNGSLRTPNSIMTAMAQVAIIFQCQQNAQYGGVAANKLDYDLAPYVTRSFRKHLRKGLRYFESSVSHTAANAAAGTGEFTASSGSSDVQPPSAGRLSDCIQHPGSTLFEHANRNDLEEMILTASMGDEQLAARYPHAYAYAVEETRTETYQAAESLVHNLNTMSSRGGGQIPFTSINYGTCTSTEGRLIVQSLLAATVRGLGHGETPIFPIQIFKCKQGINQQPGDPNYDLFLQAIECSSRRLYPNFANLDAPLNAEYMIPGEPDTEFATMGCRTRVVADRFGRNHLSGKGNLSFNTINLVKLGIDHGMYRNPLASFHRQQNQEQRPDSRLDNSTLRTTHVHMAADSAPALPDEKGFYRALDECIAIAAEALLHRYRIQAVQPAKASDFMMREGVWEGGDQLQPDEQVGDCLKHGTLSIGFIGLAECMKALYGAHHGEDEQVYERALALITYMREACDALSEQHNLNFSLMATPAEGLSGKFVQKDRQTYGSIEGVTDREYYTNSFHIPVYYPVTAARKIRLEAPFHHYCNAGAISYIELDGNARQNPEAMNSIIRYALSQNISYFSINHPIDRCTACGHEGIIGSHCPNCGASEQEVHIARLRRVTGYLTGDYQTRFNPAKQAEVRDRLKHS